MEGLDPALARRIRELRTSLNLTQAELSTKLGVTRTQVVEWEKGERERPSCEKILKIAELAPGREQRLWFLQKAGVNIASLTVDVGDERRDSTGRQRSHDLIEVPWFGESSLDSFGSIDGLPRGFIPVLKSRFNKSDPVFWLHVDHRPPWVEKSDQLVLINPKVELRDRLWNRLTAVFFSCFPVSDENLTNLTPFPLKWAGKPQRAYVDPDRSKQLKELQEALYKERDFGGEMEKRTVQRIEDVLRPGVLTGCLHIGFDCDQEFPEPVEEGEVGPWRLALEVRLPWSRLPQKIALSHWRFGRPPHPDSLTLQDFGLKDGVHILGEVVGWLDSTLSSPGSALPPSSTVK